MELNGFYPYWLPGSDKTVVRNSVVLDRMVLLTGPNMSGVQEA
jgi:DNA mismatch repair ATPase MutS